MKETSAQPEKPSVVYSDRYTTLKNRRMSMYHEGNYISATIDLHAKRKTDFGLQLRSLAQDLLTHVFRFPGVVSIRSGLGIAAPIGLAVADFIGSSKTKVKLTIPMLEAERYLAENSYTRHVFESLSSSPCECSTDAPLLEVFIVDADDPALEQMLNQAINAARLRLIYVVGYAFLVKNQRVVDGLIGSQYRIKEDVSGFGLFVRHG
jgi:hypothetical protein